MLTEFRRFRFSAVENNGFLARLAVFNIKDWIKAHHTDEATQRIEKAEIRMAENNPKKPIPMNIVRKRYLKPFFSGRIFILWSGWVQISDRLNWTAQIKII